MVDDESGVRPIWNIADPQPGRYRRSRIGGFSADMRGRRRDGNAAVTRVRVAIIMGSQSDWETMRHAAGILAELDVEHMVRIVSAHRTPDRMVAFAHAAAADGLQVIIAGAGGAAHLPGMVAAMTRVPVLGVPVQSTALAGMDALLSIVQMPAGVPVGTLAVGKAGAINAALLAAAILANHDAALAQRLDDWRTARSAAVAEQPDGATDGQPSA